MVMVPALAVAHAGALGRGLDALRRLVRPARVAAGQWRSTFWWTIAKLAIWIAPPLWILRRAGEELGEATGLATLRGVRRGLGLAAAWLAFQLIVSLLREHWPGPFRWSSGAWNAFLVAPLFEEIVFRGFALRRLRRQGIRFWPAATATQRRLWANACAGLAVHEGRDTCDPGVVRQRHVRGNAAGGHCLADAVALGLCRVPLRQQCLERRADSALFR